MKHIPIDWESPDAEATWKKLRLGKITASNMDKIITPTGKESVQVDKYLNQLLAEQITGESAESFQGNSHTERGKEFEQEAADYYAMTTGHVLERVGFCMTDDERLGCSVDRFINEDGILEIKTGMPHILVEYHLSGKLEQDHRPQTQSSLFITERTWAATLLYNPNILLKPIIINSGVNMPFQVSMMQLTDKAFSLMEEKRTKLKASGFFEEAA